MLSLDIAERKPWPFPAPGASASPAAAPAAAAASVTLELQAHPVQARLPDADTDVLIWDPTSHDAQLGALVGHSDDGAAQWVDAQGEEVPGVTHWAEMPALRLPRQRGAAQ